MVPTPHIEAKEGQIAETVLMPGDPLRAKFLADTYLENVEQFNGVRGMLGFTGTYKGKRISVMGSGMGMPSMGIYSYELFNFYGVNNIIRIGSAGGMSTDVKVYDVVIGMGASTNSNFASSYDLGEGFRFAPICSFELLQKAVEAAKSKNINIKVGNLYSSDVFYTSGPSKIKEMAELGVMAVEMEAAALYMNAAKAGKNALAICTISDHLLTHEVTTSDERQNSFTQMMEIALELA